ncbi:glutathione binding-like protein [Congregibacter sp.]|uniref:glutathione binding-like protein n=1 Tax=Congregibacter sp. TaxID=2744308 RepID=UPI003F6C2B39
MSDAMILHHYESSPYAEKIRLMFGCTDSHWCSLLSPAWPPRPKVDPLSGGYRRIPIAQKGADIFCDSALIAAEIAAATDTPELNPYSSSGAGRDLMLQAESEGFFAAITSIPAPKLLGTMLRNFGPLGTYRFVKDRSGLLSGGTSKPKAAADARQVMESLFSNTDRLLADQPWINGDAPGAADFAVYHPLWLHLSCKGKLPDSAKHLLRWYDSVGELGHGRREEITRDEAFDRARRAEPRPLPGSEEAEGLAAGRKIEVSPSDYGVVPVTGTLAAITAERVILARETEDFGTLHVHFPRIGYSVKAKP